MSDYKSKESSYHCRPKGSGPRSIERVYVERRQSSNGSHNPPRLAVPYFGEHEAERSPSYRSERRSGSYDKGQFMYVESRPSRLNYGSGHVGFNVCSDARANNQHRTSIAPEVGIKNDSRFDAAAENKERKKMRNKTVLYAGLAGITTIAASNNIYQSTKVSLARRQQVEQGSMRAAEIKNFRNQAIMLDLFSVGVAAIGVNNAVNGWKRWERLKQEEKKAKKRFQENSEGKKSIRA